jgi:hypothetical protein
MAHARGLEIETELGDERRKNRRERLSLADGGCRDGKVRVGRG